MEKSMFQKHVLDIMLAVKETALKVGAAIMSEHETYMQELQNNPTK